MAYKDFKEYIQGKRRGKEANELEREALNDPFLQDAIDGFDSIPGEHLPIIEQLKKQINGKQNHRTLWWIGIAASVILIIGIGILISPEKETNFAIKKPIQQIEKKAEITANTNLKKDSNIQKPLAGNLPKPKEKTETTESLPAVTEKAISNESMMQSDQVSISIADVAANDQPENIPNKTEVTTKTLTLPKPIYKITGVVYDEKGEPLAGANVKFENSYKGVVTDMQGKFELPTNKNSDLLKVSYIGYNEKKIAIDSDKVSIQLEPNNLALNEVVVVGYGTKKRSDLTGAISSSRSTLQEKMAGKAAGEAVKEYSFGKTEFKAYFDKNRKSNLCNNEPAKLKAAFRIDEFGRPADLTITYCDCPEFKLEFVRILNQSPNWSEKNKEVELILRVN